MLVNINGFKFMVLSLPQMGRTFDRRSCPGKCGTPRGCTYSVSVSSPLDAMFNFSTIQIFKTLQMEIRKNCRECELGANY